MTLLFFNFRKLFFALLLVFLLNIGCEKNASNQNNLIDWIPQNSSWVFQINDINTVNNALINNEVFKEFKSFNTSLTEDIERLISGTPNTTSLLTISLVGKNPMELTHIYKAPLDSTIMEFPKIMYSGIHLFIETHEEKSLYSTNIEGFTIRSTSQLLVENCIRSFQQNRGSTMSQLFVTLYNTLDSDSPLNVLVQPHKEELIKTVFEDTFLFPKTGYDWNVYDLNFEDNGFNLDGLIRIQDSLSDPMGILKENEPKKIVLDELAPDNSIAFLSLPLNDALKTEDAFKKWVRLKNIPLAQINLKLLSTIDEIGWVKLTTETALLFHAHNETQAQEYLAPVLDNVKSYRDVSYYNIKLSDDILEFSKAIATEVNPKWIAIIDGFIILTHTEEVLKTIINSYKDGNTLKERLVYTSFKENLTTQNSFFWVAQTKELMQFLKDEKNPWSKINTIKYPFIGFQGTIENNFVHLHFRVHNNQLKLKQNTVSNQFLFQLEAPLSSNPQWVKNHRTKGMDIVVQDINNTLYLFSDKGILHWKKKLSGKVQGEIKQVDLYKNKKLQMAFRTENEFLILDRNGDVVRPFSIKLSSTEPIQPLSVFDYDQRRNYRFLIAQGTSLQMYDSRGKKVNGFTFKKTRSPLINPPSHIRIGQKDYIIVQEQNGTLNILNRLGKQRVTLKENVSFSGNPISSYLNTFTTSDKNGNLIQIDIRGNVVKTPLELRNGHRIETTTKSLVTLSENILNIKGIPVTLPYGQYTPPRIYYINNVIYVTTTDLDTEKVYLFFSNGTPVSGFPVYGSSAASLSNADKDKAVELVVQSEQDGMIVYEIN